MTIPEIDDNNGNRYSNFVFFKKGGMGEIYKGQDCKSGKDVVLKLIAITDPSDESLLVREVDACKHLCDKNIVKTIITGKIKIETLDYFYVLQEFYPSGNMRSLIKNGVSLEKCYEMMNDILCGLREVHKNIVHRDLKPENILIDTDGHLLIADFGLSKYIDEKTRTRSFKGAGTRPYMAPECWNGETNTISMDIYSLGIIFFEILTGKWPFNGNTDQEWRDCHLYDALPDISKYRTDISTKLKQIIQKMTIKRASERYKSVDEIIVALNECVKLNNENLKEIDRLASLADFAMQQKTANELRASQEAERVHNYIKLLNYHIAELFNKFTENANLINARFETGKIIVTGQPSNEYSTKRKLSLSFNGKGINIQIGSYEDVDKYEKDINEKSINFQRQQYGMVMQSPGDSFLKQNDIVLIGLAETSFKIGDIEFGFNLLLKKPKEMNYGEWYIVSFKENCMPPKPSFAIDLSAFFREYEKFRGSPYHKMEFRQMKDADIISLLEKIFMF
jgi:serine/threonine protein kinase